MSHLGQAVTTAPADSLPAPGAPAPASRALAGLFLLSLICSVGVWAYIVLPVLSGNMAGHEAHRVLLYGHALAGSLMLFTGAAALYVGWTRRFFGAHRWIGGSYLLSGTIASLLALAAPLVTSHQPASIGSATNVIAGVWLAFSAMAWRAIRNRRFDAHRQWMIRSYVVTWTFVFCRMAMQLPLFPSLGAEGVTATIWTSFIVPVVICEIVLQWSSTSALPGRSVG